MKLNPRLTMKRRGKIPKGKAKTVKPKIQAAKPPLHTKEKLQDNVSVLCPSHTGG